MLPQSPMHTKSLAVLKRQLMRRKMEESAKENIKKNAPTSEIYGQMQAIFIEMDQSPDVSSLGTHNSLLDLANPLNFLHQLGHKKRVMHISREC